VASSNPFARGFVFVGGSPLDAVSGTLPQTLTDARVSRRAVASGLATYINDAGGAGSNLSFGPGRAACMAGATQGTWVVQFVLDNTSDSPHLFGSWNLPSTNHWLIQATGTGLIWIPADEGASNRRRWDGSGLFTAGRVHTLALVWNGGASYVAFLDGREITLSAVDATANSIRPAPSFIHMGNYLSGAANRFSTLIAACTPVAVPRLTAQALSSNPWPLIEQPTRPLWAPSVAATVYRLISDTITNGWTAVGAASVAAATNEAIPSDAEYGLSPDLSSSYTGAIPSMPAGNYTVTFRGDRTLTDGQVRIRYLDSGGVDVGGTAWQALTGTATEYALSATTTATATQARIEVQP
jgi:hypothetical protein